MPASPRPRRRDAASIRLSTALALATGALVVTPAPAQAAASLEAEALAGAGVVVGDAAAGGAKALVFYSNGLAAGSVTTTATTSRLVIRARGQQCNGAPRLVAHVDGRRVLSTSVSAVGYQNHAADVQLAAGVHRLQVGYDNDYRSGCDRNLIVDAVSLDPATTPPPPPPPITPVKPPATPWVDPSVPDVPARASDTFVDSVGVNTHLHYGDTAYARQTEVLAKLRAAGIRHVRDGLMPNRPDQWRGFNLLASSGIRSTLVMGDPVGRYGAGTLGDLVPVLRDQVRGAVEAVEGANEFDLSRRTSWEVLLRDHQRRLYAAVKSDPALSALPVLGPSLVTRNNQIKVGDLSAAMDRGNFHPYPGGMPVGRPVQGGKTLRTLMTEAAINSATKPIVATETGYHNALRTTDTHRPTSERAAAIYMPKLFLEFFRHGIARTFAYELVDQRPDAGLGRRDMHFGLLRSDFSEKPAFTAVRAWNQTLADPGPGFAPDALRYALEGDTADARSLLLQRRDGTFLLALWRETSAWDSFARTDLTVPPRPVTVRLGEEVGEVIVRTPSTGAAARVDASAHAVTVGLGEQAQLLELDPR